jgi:hypothetical protein
MCRAISSGEMTACSLMEEVRTLKRHERMAGLVRERDLYAVLPVEDDPFLKISKAVRRFRPAVPLAGELSGSVAVRRQADPPPTPEADSRLCRCPRHRCRPHPGLPPAVVTCSRSVLEVTYTQDGQGDIRSSTRSSDTLGSTESS